MPLLWYTVKYFFDINPVSVVWRCTSRHLPLSASLNDKVNLQHYTLTYSDAIRTNYYLPHAKSKKTGINWAILANITKEPTDWTSDWTFQQWVNKKITEVVCEDGRWVKWDQYRVQWRALVSAGPSLRILSPDSHKSVDAGLLGCDKSQKTTIDIFTAVRTSDLRVTYKMQRQVSLEPRIGFITEPK
jgi:hypothetical protein